MALPRGVPEPTCGENLGPGSYMISATTDSSIPGVALDGAFASFEARKVGSKYLVLPYTLGLKNITDGTSKTLLVGENDYGLDNLVWDNCGTLNGTQKGGDQTWANGYWHSALGHINWKIFALSMRGFFNRSRINDDEKSVQNTIVRVFRSDHVGGVQFTFLDGSVRFVPEEVDYSVLRALVTRAGEETNYDFN
jgi:hypothetical protein